MAEKLKRAAWLGDRYADYDEPDEAHGNREGLSREEFVGSPSRQPASVTPLKPDVRLLPLHPHPSPGRQTCPESSRFIRAPTTTPARSASTSAMECQSS